VRNANDLRRVLGARRTRKRKPRTKREKYLAYLRLFQNQPDPKNRPKAVDAMCRERFGLYTDLEPPEFTADGRLA
jgi:hypothetical protein